MKINNDRVYGLEESIIASGYPLRANLEDLWEDANYLEENSSLVEINEILKLLENGCGKVNNYRLSNCNSYIEMTLGNSDKIVKLSMCDVIKVSKLGWTYNNSRGYIQSTTEPLIELQRYVMGKNDDDLVVDHKNRDVFDNRKENLRWATKSQNSFNNSGHKHNVSGVTGVYFSSNKDRWIACVEKDGKRITRSFKNKDDAIKCRLLLEIEYFKEFAPQLHLLEQYDIDNPFKENHEINKSLIIGSKHIKRVKNLSNTLLGSGHNCALKGIIVQYDLTAPEYFWRQFDRYHFHDYVSSQSKMHCILKFDIAKLCNKYVDVRVIDIVNEYISIYNDMVSDNLPKERLSEVFQQIISNCPMGLELTARITDNYLQLKSKYHQRKNHKLEEWAIYCDWIKTLPMAEELIIGEK